MQFNAQAAKAAGYSDEEIANYLAQEQKFNLQGALQSGYSYGEIVNFLAAPPPAEKTGMLRAAADIPVQVGRGVAVGVKALSDAFGADNPVSKAASGVEDWLGGLLSAQAKNDQAEIARIMKDAEDKGVGDQVTAAVKAFATAPVDMLSQALGTAVPVIAGGLAGSVARLGAMGAGAVGAGVGATMGAGTVKGQVYDAVKQELLQNKVPEAEAERRAQQAQEYGGQNLDQILMGAGIGAVEAAFGAERILTGLLKKGAIKPSALPAKYGIPTAAATEAVPEMAQAAQEQVAQNIALQREGYDVPTMRGVVGQAALEGLAGAGLGALTGAVERAKAPQPKPEPVEEEKGTTLKPAPVLESDKGPGVSEETVPPVSPLTAAEEPTATRPTIQELRARADREAQLQAERAGAGFDFEQRMAQEQIAAGREMQKPVAEERPEYIDLRPLQTPLAQRQALVVAKDEARQQGIDPERIELAPHPKVPDAMALIRTPAPEVVAPVEPTVKPEEVQARLEQAALTGKELERRKEDEPRQIVLTRALQNIADRNGVASPEEARIVQEANVGKPYDRIDESLGRTLSEDEKLTQATGIALGKKPRESTTYEATEPFTYTPELQGEKKPEPIAEEKVSDEDATVRAYIASFERPNTPAARAFKQAVDRGEITNADILQAVQSKLPVDEVATRLQEAAKQAPGERITPAGIRYALRSEKGATQQVADFEQTLRTTLNKFGLKDVGLNLVDGLKEAGSYAQKLIKIAADSANPIRDLRHEAIHALRELGFFTDAQWKSLSKMANDKWIDQYLKQRNVDGKPLKAGEESRYDAYMREYDGDMEKITEEAVADAFADFDATKPPSGLMQSLLTRMRNLFQAIKSALTKVESPEQIFGKVERGELRAGERKEAGERKSLSKSQKVFDLSLPEDANKLRYYKIGDTTVSLDANANTKQIKVSSIRTPVAKRGTGSARTAMELLIKQADEEGVQLFLDASSLDSRTSTKKLVSFYESLGFKPTGRKINAVGDLEMSREPGIRKSLRSEKPTSTPTAAGQKALDTINQLGMGVQPPPDSKIEEAKATIKKLREDPELTKKTALDAFRKFMDKFETASFSADAAFQNDLRRGLQQDMAGMEEFLGSQLDSSQSQAVGADAVSTQAVLRGRAEYDTEVRKWVAVDDKNNLTELSRQLEQIAEKYGLTKEEAQRIAHTYFVAKNYDGILKRNARIEAEIKQLEAEGKDEEAKERKDALVFVSPEQAAMVQPGKALVSTIPELSKLVDTWDGIRKNFVRTLVSTGLWSPEYATAMIDNIDYVPFYRDEQIEANEGPREMIRGLQVKAKEHKLKGSKDSVNDVFDNMARWMQYAMNRSIRNHKALQMVDIATDLKVGDRMMATKVSEAKRGMNIVKVWRDGKQELYEMADPLYLDAFQSLSTVSIPAIKYFTSIANMLRRSVVAYPLFSIGQVPQDAVAAIFSSGLKPRFALKIPYLAVKEFIKTLRGTSETHKELKRFGAVGVRDFNANVLRQDAEILAGIKAPRGVKDKVMYALDHIAMSADNAVRQAVYTASIEAGLQKSEAMEKAFDVINFRRRGSSKLLNLMGQTVPFFYAYLSAQRVAYRTLTGTGISPTTRKAALETLAQTSAAVMALSFLYSMANGDDEEYEKTPGTIRDRSLLIPGSGGVRIPLRPDFFLLPKIIAEHTYQLLSDNGYSDGAKFRKGMYEVLANSVLSPNPVPQAIKPLVEIGINYSFFEGRPIVGFFEQNKEAGRQFSENTSEMAKLFGNLGASPEKVDHFIRGYFGSVGGLFLWATNFFIEGEPGVPRPSITWDEALQTMPGVGAFRQKPNENALKVDFYELRDAVAKAKNTYDDIKLRSPEGLEAFIEDETNVARLAMEKGVTKIADHLSKIRRARQQISNMPESQMSSEEKQERIKELKEVEVELLKSVDVKSLRAQARL
jgi:hypothetical protein